MQVVRLATGLTRSLEAERTEQELYRIEGKDSVYQEHARFSSRGHGLGFWNR